MEADRVTCPHEDRCSGCPGIALPYAAQLLAKRKRVQDALARHVALRGGEVPETVGAPILVGYRTRAKLVFAAPGDLGLFAQGGDHEVLDIPHCRVLSPTLARVAQAVRTDARERPAFARALRAVDLREAQFGGATQVLLTWVLDAKAKWGIEALRAEASAFLRRVPDVVGVAVNFEGPTPQILGARTQHLAGSSEAKDRTGGAYHLATFGAFAQAHRDQAQRVLDWMVDALPGAGARVLDLYGGSGPYALALAARGVRVHLVELFAPSVDAARRAADAQGLPLEATQGDVADVLRAGIPGGPLDAVIANPPRRGLAPAVRSAIAALGAKQLFYVSCDPDTLARDLDHFVRLGYAAEPPRPLDMIPLTDEVECFAVLHPKSAPGLRILDESPLALAVATCPHDTEVLERVRQREGWSGARAVVSPPGAASGVALFTRPGTGARLEGGSVGVEVWVLAHGVTHAKGNLSRVRHRAGEEAPRTRYQRVAVIGGHSVLRIEGTASRLNAIARDLARIGHPLLGDDRFGHPPTNTYFRERHTLDRPAFHLFSITVPGPTPQKVTEDPPGDFATLLERLGGADGRRALRLLRDGGKKAAEAST